MTIFLMVCGVLSGLPAALLVFAVDWRSGDDSDDSDDERLDARGILQSKMTQTQLFTYMAGEVTR